MARYVVVEIADNEDAQAFIDRINDETIVDGKRRVVGLFVKPIHLCECPEWRHTNAGDKNRKYGVVRGSQFGWWICERCKRPRRAGHTLVNKLLPSQLYPELNGHEEVEMTVTGLGITGIYHKNIDRPKKLRKVAKRWLAGS